MHRQSYQKWKKILDSLRNHSATLLASGTCQTPLAFIYLFIYFYFEENKTKLNNVELNK